MASRPPEDDLSALRIDRSARPTPAPRPRRVRLLWSGALVVLGALGTLLYLLPGWGTNEPTVELYTVTYRSGRALSALLTASGYVVAQRQAAVSSKATGRLVHLGVEEGDRVTAGQLLGRVESADVEAELARAEAQAEVASGALATALARLKEARLQFDRVSDLRSRELVSQSEFDTYDAALAVAQAEVAQAKAGREAAQAAVRAARVAVENTQIRAPFAGTVLTKEADVGEMVAPFGSAQSARGAVVTLADMESLEVEADVSEANIQRVSVGHAAQIVLDAYPGQNYRGRVKKIVPTADRAKATVLTKVEFLDRDQRVLPEMSAKVTFLEAESLGEGTPAELAVPAEAVQSSGAEEFVYTVSDHLARRRVVVAGDASGGMRVVRRGLREGDRVVVHSTSPLSDGQTVRIP